jgi:hypothetical protein
LRVGCMIFCKNGVHVTPFSFTRVPAVYKQSTIIHSDFSKRGKLWSQKN